MPLVLLPHIPDDAGSDNESVPLPKQTKPTQVDAAPPAKGAPKSGAIPNATTRRNVPGQTTVRPQKEAKELPASDAPAGSQAQFEGERGRDDRGNNFGRGRGRGAPRGGDRGRGGRGGRGGRPERLDRRSATGITDSNKQEHQAWGGDEGKRELEAETAGLTDAAAEKINGGEATPALVEGDATPAAAEGQDATPAAPAEPEDNSQSYEDYLKARSAAGKVGGALETRKANEGQDDSQWSNGVAITKPTSGEDHYFQGSQKEKAQRQKARKEKTLLEVGFTAPRIDRGDREERSDRGGRGGARGGRGRGEGGRGRGEGRGGRGRGGAAPRGGRANGSAGVNVDDSTAFPSLS